MASYLPSYHALNAEFVAPTAGAFRELIDRAALEGMTAVTREQPISQHEPGTVIAIRQPGTRFAYWAVLLGKCQGKDGSTSNTIALAGYPPRSGDVPAYKLGDSRSHMIGDTSELTLNLDAKCYLPKAGAVQEGIAVAPEDLPSLRRGSKLILFNKRTDKLAGHVSEGAVLLGVDDSTLHYKQPRCARFTEKRARSPFADPEADAPHREPWVERSRDTKSGWRMVPHPFYRNAAGSAGSGEPSG